MKNRKSITYLVLFIVALTSITIVFYDPIGIEAEKQYKSLALNALMTPVFALIAMRFISYRGKTWNYVFAIAFALAFSGGLGIIIKTYFALNTMSYLGLLSVNSSLMFLVLFLANKYLQKKDK